jgi:hypothetical protein
MRSFGWCLLLGVLASPAVGWDAHTHRVVTALALEAAEQRLPAWLREEEARLRIAFQSNQADRWRGWDAAAVRHVNDPDHYLDADLLAEFGLTLETLPELRREYLRTMAIAKHLHPERVSAYDPGDDPRRTKEWPGFLLHRISEEYAALQAALNQVQILEKLDAPARRAQLAQARAIAVYHLGNLSHFVADAAQPLHTTKHFNGWAGENPHGYTTDRGFHRYIDQGVIAHHGITAEGLRPRVSLTRRVAADGAWAAVRDYFAASFARVEPLYRLERDGLLDGPEGKLFIERRLLDAVDMLHALVVAAVETSRPTEEQVADFVKYNNFGGHTNAAVEKDAASRDGGTDAAADTSEAANE